MLGLPNGSFAAWCIDEATFTWGRFVESELDAAGEKGQDADSRLEYRKMRMQELLAEGEVKQEVTEEVAEVTPIQRAPRRFADPAELLNRGSRV